MGGNSAPRLIRSIRILAHGRPFRCAKEQGAVALGLEQFKFMCRGTAFEEFSEKFLYASRTLDDVMRRRKQNGVIGVECGDRAASALPNAASQAA